MSKVVLFGAGLVARPLVHYLLRLPGMHLTVATRTRSKADALIQGFDNASTTTLLSDDRERMGRLIADHDLAISLLPAPQHPPVAELCITHRKPMVTTSYISPTMRSYDSAARDAGVLILNEIGVDPGIDHMSAVRIIHDAQLRGGKVVSFRSYCGGLPAPDSNDNPFGYKVSWTPRGVCTAGKNSADYLENDKKVHIPGPQLFTCNHPVRVAGIGTLEGYPNRDSLSYIDIYGLQGISTMYRGTLRYPGWCETLKKIVDLGLLEETLVQYPVGMKAAQFTASLIGSDAKVGDLRTALARKLQLPTNSPILDRLAWLGLMSDQAIPHAGTQSTPLDVLAGLMAEKMVYRSGERDMIVMLHEFILRFPKGTDQRLVSTLIVYGEPGGDSAMARTVGLPAAIAVRLILDGRLNLTGVHAPMVPEIYEPVLDELQQFGIQFVEE